MHAGATEAAGWRFLNERPPTLVHHREPWAAVRQVAENFAEDNVGVLLCTKHQVEAFNKLRPLWQRLRGCRCVSRSFLRDAKKTHCAPLMAFIGAFVRTHLLQHRRRMQETLDHGVHVACVPEVLNPCARRGWRGFAQEALALRRAKAARARNTGSISLGTLTKRN